MIDEGERIVTIEDAAELQLQQPHVVRLETRPPNLEGKGEITMRDLVKNTLRMRPDRIILGEIRGAEAMDVLQAMNTGHDGSLCTIHANRPREALTRLENMVGMSGVNLPAKAVRQQIAAAVHMIVQVSRMRDGVRRIIAVTEVVGMEGEIITTQDLFTYQFEGEGPDGKLNGRFVGSGLRPHFTPRAEYYGLDQGAAGGDRMSGLLDDPMIIMLGVGIGIVLICLFFAFGDDSSKKQAKRVDRLRTRGQGVSPGEELTLRKSGGDRKKLDQMMRRFVPKPDMLRQRLYRTGHTISLGTFGIICGVVAIVAFVMILLFDFSFLIALPLGALAGMWLPLYGRDVARWSAQQALHDAFP